MNWLPWIMTLCALAAVPVAWLAGRATGHLEGSKVGYQEGWNARNARATHPTSAVRERHLWRIDEHLN